MQESASDEAQWLPNALPLLELHFCKSCKSLKSWLERQTSTKLGPQDTIKKFLKHRFLRCPCIVHLNLICMSYDFKKRQESNSHQIEILIPDHKSLENKGQMSFDWGVIYTFKKIFLRAIRYYPFILKIDLIWKIYEHPRFWDIKSLNFGTPTWNSWGKVTLGCNSCIEAHSML